MPSPSVLVVEDHPGLRHALREGLAVEGFDVTDVADAPAAYALAARLAPDLVVLDWLLGGEDDGPAACRRLRDLAPGARVVILTGLDIEAPERRAASDAGACVVLR